MKTTTIMVGISLVLWTSAGVAGSLDKGTSYGGVQFASVTYSDDRFSDDVEPTALVGRFGTFVEDRFSVEGRLGFGLSDDSLGGADFEVDHLLGVYGLGHLPVGANASVYGALGFTNAEGTASNSLGSESDSDSGLSYGVGADVWLTETVDFNVEFMQYLNKSDFDASALAFGLRFSF